MALTSIHQSFHFKTAHLIYKYFIGFCSWRILLSLLLPSQLNILAMGKYHFKQSIEKKQTFPIKNVKAYA